MTEATMRAASLFELGQKLTGELGTLIRTVATVVVMWLVLRTLAHTRGQLAPMVGAAMLGALALFFVWNPRWLMDRISETLAMAPAPHILHALPV